MFSFFKKQPTEEERWQNHFEDAKNGKKLAGFAHDNYRFVVDGQNCLFRSATSGVSIMDPHAFDEPDVLKMLSDKAIQAPKLIYRDPNNGFYVESFIDGLLVDNRYPPGDLLPEFLLDEMVSLIKQLHLLNVSLDEIKKVIYSGWPLDGDAKKFSRELIRWSEDAFSRNSETHRQYYDILGFNNDPYAYFKDYGETKLAKRPWCFIHGDMSRANAILTQDQKIHLIDWQLALFGDPLYDIAKHIHMWRYLETEKNLFIKKMKAELSEEFLVNFDEDLEFYLSFEALKSVITDTVRFPIAFKQERFDTKKEAEYCLYFSDNLRKISPLTGAKTITPDEALRYFQEWG